MNDELCVSGVLTDDRRGQRKSMTETHERQNGWAVITRVLVPPEPLRRVEIVPMGDPVFASFGYDDDAA